MRRKWKDDEKKYLAKHYATTTEEELANILGRSARSVHCQATRQGLQKPPRTHAEIHRPPPQMAKDRVRHPREDEYLAEHYGKTKIDTIAQHLNLSVDATIKRALRLGLKSSIRQGAVVTEAMKLHMRANHTNKTVDELANDCELPDDKVLQFLRSEGLAAKQRGRRKWTKEENELIASKYDGENDRELALQLGRSPSSIRTKVCHMRSDGIKFPLAA